MAKKVIVSETNSTVYGKIHWIIWCQGCNEFHSFDSRWTFNENFEKPTFSPSLLYDRERPDDPNYRCHTYVTDGKIQFLSDCTHALAGQTLDLEDIEQHY